MLARIHEDEPGAIGLVAFGSYARGEATPSSDLDLQAVLAGDPRIGYRTWFLGDLHISIGFAAAAPLQEALARPVDWALGFAVDMPAVWVWSTKEALAALGDPPDFSRPAREPELEDFVEWCAKALRADEPLTLRVSARGLGEEAPALLRDLNGGARVRNRFEAVRVARDFAVAPEGWAEDLLVLLGLSPAGDKHVRLAVERLGRGTLALLREQGSRIGEAQPEVNGYLHDRTLERHLGFA